MRALRAVTVAAFAAATVAAVAGCGTATRLTSGSGTSASSASSVVTSTAAPSSSAPAAAPVVVAAVPPMPAAPVAKPVSAQCAGNTAAQFVLVEISAQHAGMCAKTTLVYDTPVTTGETDNGDDTPTGTWFVQSRQTNRDLVTLDGTHYPVKYWMPYDDIYGFHDASWQTIAYGSTGYHSAGSHGCVHLPLPAMAWLYNWAAVGAKVTVRV